MLLSYLPWIFIAALVAMTTTTMFKAVCRMYLRLEISELNITADDAPSFWLVQIIFLGTKIF